MKQFSLLTITIGLLFSTNHVHGQGTYEKVYTIFQTNCAVSGCHVYGVAAGQLDLGDTPANVYSKLFEGTPDNSVAAGKGYQLVDPGNVRNSYLMKKINNGLDPYNDLAGGEGDAMPQTGPALSDVDIETIRQWILFGAPDDTVDYIDVAMLTDFYENGKGAAKIPVPQPPPANEGFQAYYGPLFIPPFTEVEYSDKFEVLNPTAMEVTRMDNKMNEESHHVALYKFNDNTAANIFPDGYRKVNGVADAAAVFFNAEVIEQWANSLDIDLPTGTAFFWDTNTVLDLNYHVINAEDSILAAEFYINFYTQPSGTAEAEMNSLPVYYGGDNVTDLFIPPNDDSTFTWHQYLEDTTDVIWSVWFMMAHTHPLGKEYNVYLRNPNGSKGDRIYDGTYNQEYTQQIGFFDWEHPPVLTMDPMLEVNMKHGLIHEAKFVNTTNDTVGFGLTNDDEMFVTYMHYIDGKLATGIEDNVSYSRDGTIKVYPNPFSETTTIEIADSKQFNIDLELRIYDIYGKQVQLLGAIKSSKVQVHRNGLSSGIYFYEINDGLDRIGKGKLMIH